MSIASASRNSFLVAQSRVQRMLPPFAASFNSLAYPQNCTLTVTRILYRALTIVCALVMEYGLHLLKLTALGKIELNLPLVKSKAMHDD